MIRPIAVLLAVCLLATGSASAGEADQVLRERGKPLEGRLLTETFELETEHGVFAFDREQLWDLHIPAHEDWPVIVRTRDGDRVSGHLASWDLAIDIAGRGVVDLDRSKITRVIFAGTGDADGAATPTSGHRVILRNGDRLHGHVQPQTAPLSLGETTLAVELASLTRIVFGGPRGDPEGAALAIVGSSGAPIVANHQIRQIDIRLHSGRKVALDLSQLAAIENLADGQASAWETTSYRDRHADGSTCAYCPLMQVIPPGRYAMGAREAESMNRPYEGPVHMVDIAYPFAMGVYEVTFDQWDACRADGGCRHRGADERFGRGSRPAISLNLADANEFLDWLSAKTGIAYRLPSESEWELAARAGSTTAYYWGDRLGRANAVCEACRTEWDNRKTAPTGTFPPNPFGLYDILGNAWEWTADCWSEGYENTPTDGSASREGDCRGHVMRGGAWFSFPENVRTATRFRSVIDTRYLSKGLRVVRDF